MSILLVATVCDAEDRQLEPLYFDVTDVGEPASDVSVIEPWKIVQLDAEYGGQWVVAGDVDGDGKVEIVSAENVNKDDVHYTSTAAAQNLDGSVLWRWGDPESGRKNWHHDVACQIHDWDGDGKNEVVLCTKGAVVELDGRSGSERRRIAIADDATDCIVFCDLGGVGRACDILVKDRYRRIWAYNQQGRVLWTVTEPGGYRTAHQPRPMDIDGDGRDEIMAGYAMLNADGSVRWVFQSKNVDQRRGHLDCARVFRQGDAPEEFRIVLTCCGANNVAMVDGNGQVLWEVAGHHFESADVGQVLPGGSGPQVVVDIDHQPLGKSPIWVLDGGGKLLGQIVTDYSRHHCLLDWTGDAVNEIMVGHNGGIYDHQGRRIGSFATPGSGPGDKGERSILVAEMTGDGVPDVMIVTSERVYVYKNAEGEGAGDSVGLGTEPNFTLY